MIYEIAHFVKEKLGFLWDAVEWGNSKAFVMLHKSGMRDVPVILNSVCSNSLTIRATEEGDAKKLEKFFSEQPEDAFKFFKPHGFDEKSIMKVLKNEAFMTFVVCSEADIVGYFFLRAFVNGKCFRGKIVDFRWRGKGIAKQMGIATTKVAQTLGLRMFGTISPDNYASLESSKASNVVKIHKTLSNGYYYIEYLPKEEN